MEEALAASLPELSYKVRRILLRTCRMPPYHEDEGCLS